MALSNLNFKHLSGGSSFIAAKNYALLNGLRTNFFLVSMHTASSFRNRLSFDRVSRLFSSESKSSNLKIHMLNSFRTISLKIC